MKILGKVSMEKIYCQSCGMPMSDRDERLSDFGDNHPFDRCVMQNLAQGCKIFFSNIVFIT